MEPGGLPSMGSRRVGHYWSDLAVAVFHLNMYHIFFIQSSVTGESHGQRSLVGYIPWGHKELDMTEWLSTAQQHILHLQRPCSKLVHHKSWVDISFGGHHSIHHKRSHGIHWANKQAGTSSLILCDQHMVLAYGSLMLNYLSLTWCLFQPKHSSFILYCVDLVLSWQGNCFNQKSSVLDFPSGSVVKNPFGNEGETGLIPDPGRSHMLWSN